MVGRWLLAVGRDVMEAVNGERPTANGQRPELVIFVGLPGSGKSTYYFAHLAPTHAHVSKDLMPNARRRDDRQTLVVEKALADGQSVVIDNTNPSRAIRAPLIALGRRHDARIIA